MVAVNDTARRPVTPKPKVADSTKANNNPSHRRVAIRSSKPMPVNDTVVMAA